MTLREAAQTRTNMKARHRALWKLTKEYLKHDLEDIKELIKIRWTFFECRLVILFAWARDIGAFWIIILGICLGIGIIIFLNLI